MSLCACLPASLLRMREMHVSCTDLLVYMCVWVVVKRLHGLELAWCLLQHLCVSVRMCVCVRVSPEGKALKRCVPESKQL